MSKIEARELKETLGVETSDVAAFVETLKNTSWALYQTEEEYEASAEKGFFRVTSCRTQENRKAKGFQEFPCKQVRLSYLQSFAEEFNPNIRVICLSYPPNRHPKETWCEWKFTLRK